MMYSRFVALIPATLVPDMALAQQGNDVWSTLPHMWMSNGYGMILGPIIMLLALALIIVGVVWVIRSMNNGNRPSSQTSAADPMDLLPGQNAFKEIDSEEFEEGKSGLMD